MNAALEIAASGLSAQQKALDIIANNVANVNTNAFKRSSVQFSDMIAHAAIGESLAANLATAPSLSGVSSRGAIELFEQGEIERTGHLLDVAIDGQGFIELMGPAGETLLWRGGRLAVGDDGYLSGEGFALKGAIAIEPAMSALRIDAAGRVFATTAPGSESEIGRIEIVEAESAADVERMDDGLYRLTETGAAGAMRASSASALVQGGLERSNVRLSEEMVQLLIVQRAFAANAQIVQAADQLSAIANNLKR